MSTILVVDDSEHVRDKLINALSKESHDILSAENGEEGLKIFQANEQINLIITDLNMPVMSGLKMCEEISKLSQTKKVPPILVLSSESDPELKGTMKKLGVIAWIIKPFKDDSVCNVVTQILKKVNAG